MKMQVTLTLDEVKPIVESAIRDRYYTINVTDISVNIISNVDNPMMRIVSATYSNCGRPILPLHTIVSNLRDNYPQHRTDQKIAAIRYLREQCALAGVFIGLGEAKQFVESL